MNRNNFVMQVWIALFALIYQMGVCPCGCPDHSFWYLIFQTPEDVDHVAGVSLLTEVGNVVGNEAAREWPSLIRQAVVDQAVAASNSGARSEALRRVQGSTDSDCNHLPRPSYLGDDGRRDARGVSDELGGQAAYPTKSLSLAANQPTFLRPPPGLERSHLCRAYLQVFRL